MLNQPVVSSESEPANISGKSLRQKIYHKRASKISLLALLLATIVQFVSVYQTERNLVSPLIPTTLVWDINRQYIFMAFLFTVSSFVGLILYFYDRYLWVIVWVLLILIASRYIYLPTS